MPGHRGKDALSIVPLRAPPRPRRLCQWPANLHRGSGHHHTTLKDLVTRAELVTALSASGTFTLFAPTNAAFDAVPAGNLKTKITAIPISVNWKPLLQDVSTLPAHRAHGQEKKRWASCGMWLACNLAGHVTLPKHPHATLHTSVAAYYHHHGIMCHGPPCPSWDES